jgi:hypothetical protein
MELLNVIEGIDGFSQPINSLRNQPDYDKRLTEALRLMSGDGMSETKRAYLISEAFKTTDFPVLLGDSIERAVIANYQSFPDQVDGIWTTVKKIVQAGSVGTFNTAKRVRLNVSSLLEEVVESYQYTDASASETEYSYSVKKYGKKFPISWESIVNDTLGAFASVPRDMAIAAKESEEKFITGMYFDSAGPKTAYFEASGGCNGGTLSTLALSATNLKTAVAQFGKMFNVGGIPVFNRPKYLVVPPSLEVTAREILNSTTYVTGSDIMIPGQSIIPQLGLQLVVAKWIPGIVTSGTVADTCWALFADPAYLPAGEFGTLRGFQNPSLFMKSANQVSLNGGSVDPMLGSFESDTIEYKVKSVFGGCTLDPRAGWASKGQ